MKRLMNIRRPFLLTLLFGCAIMFSGLTACKEEEHPSPWSQGNSLTISQYLDKHKDEYSKFYQLLVSAKMFQTLYAYNPKGSDWTLLLPTNEAIDQFVAANPNYENFEALIKDTTFIKRLTRYHIIKKKLHTNEFPDGAFIDSTLTGDRLLSSFFAENNYPLIKINHTAPIVKPNLDMTNGYIHVISKVLQPSDISGYDWLHQQSRYSILAKAMDLAGISKKLTWDKYSLLAEPDSVYNCYGIYSAEDLVSKIATSGVSLTNKTNVFYQFVAYHLLKGEFYLNDFYWGTHKYMTLSEQPVTIEVWQDVQINTGVDTYIHTNSATDTTSLTYIRPITEKCNMLTRTGPVHSITDLMYYAKLPKVVKKSS